MSYNSLVAIVGRIQNELSGGRPVDDTVFDKEHIADAVHKVRAMLIRDYIEKKKKVDPSYYQKIDCIDIVCEEITCDGVKSGVKVNRIELPTLIGAGSQTIGYLGTPDMRNDFEPRSFVTHDNTEGAVWGGKNPYYFRIANIADLYNLPTANMKFVTAVVLAADPMEVEGCDEETPYPIPGDRLHKLELLVKQDLASLMLQLPVDKQNDANPQKPTAPPSRKRTKNE